MSGYLCDAGRLVIQCLCERTVRWSGEDAARAQGWHGGWRARQGGELRRVWTCEECYRPPAPAREPEATGLPYYLRELITRGEQALVLEQLRALELEHPARLRVYLADIEREGRLWKGPAGRERWAAPLRAFGIEVEWAGKRRRKAARERQEGTRA